MMSIIDLGKRLLESAKLGETDEVRLLMTNGAPFTTDWLGNSPLHMAAQYGHVETAEVLLRAGISRDARTKVDRTPLHIASQEGHRDIVELLIKHGAEINALDMLRMTPLHWAVERSHVTVINCLLCHGADVLAVSKFYKTPINIAADNGRKDIVEVLKEYEESNNSKKIREIHHPKHSTTSTSKGSFVIQKNHAVITGVPFNIIKTNSLSAEQLKHIVNKTAKSLDPNVNTTSSITTTSAKTTSRPVFIRANVAQTTSLKNSHTKATVSGESTTQNSTNVLATLAALAEATAPNSTISTQEALQWLEMHGISMLPSDNSTVVASALEGGQTVSLTEAGKLALTWVKQQTDNSSKEVSSSVQEVPVLNMALPNNVSSSNQKVITIVAGQTSIPSIISSHQQPFVVLGHQNSKLSDPPPLKRIKTFVTKKDDKFEVNGKFYVPPVVDNEKFILKKELEKIRKEAAEYKAKLLVKEHEAEVYRRQLEQLKQNQ